MPPQAMVTALPAAGPLWFYLVSPVVRPGDCPVTISARPLRPDIHAGRKPARCPCGRVLSSGKSIPVRKWNSLLDGQVHYIDACRGVK